jgi:hypothetical protein
METQKIILLIDSNRGVYIPKQFTEIYGSELPKNASNEKKVNLMLALLDLHFPENENYWSSWEYVLDNFTLTFEGTEYYLYQESDLWAVPVGTEFEDYLQ